MLDQSKLDIVGHKKMSMYTSSTPFMRVASCAPELRVGDVDFNVIQMQAAMSTAAQRGAALIVFPELSLTAYTCADLFAQSIVVNNAWEALKRLASETARTKIHAIVGLPLAIQGRLYNCAAMIGDGVVLGIVPKVFLPTSGEFYEERWFTSGKNIQSSQIDMGSYAVPFTTDLLFPVTSVPGCTIGIEICEDLWAVEPPSGSQALAGATLLCNISASNELLGKNAYRKDLVKSQSARCLAAYVYASAGPGESSTDLVFSGHCMVMENGIVLAESERFRFDTQIIYADVDFERIQHERLCNSSFSRFVEKDIPCGAGDIQGHRAGT